LVSGKFHLFIISLSNPESIATFILSKLLRKPVIVLDEHWYWRKNMLMKALWPIARFIAYHSIYLCVPGIRAKSFWDLVGVPAEKIRLIHFDVSVLEPNEKHLKMAEEIKHSFDNRKIVLYFGRLEKRKGVDYLIRAFVRLYKERGDMVLLVAGEGPEKAHLQELCEKLNIKPEVYFAGFVDEDCKAAYFLACDVFVCPSITLDMPEIWGLVVNEAMSVGKPVIATTAVGSAYDLVENGVNGFIVPERDIDALYRAMKLVLGSSTLMIRMGKASKERIEKGFTYHHTLQDLSEAIKSAILKSQRQIM
jgi:glycosyltransferase involved in cell wall biosynthesis